MPERLKPLPGAAVRVAAHSHRAPGAVADVHDAPSPDGGHESLLTQELDSRLVSGYRSAASSGTSGPWSRCWASRVNDPARTCRSCGWRSRVPPLLGYAGGSRVVLTPERRGSTPPR